MLREFTVSCSVIEVTRIIDPRLFKGQNNVVVHAWIPIIYVTTWVTPPSLWKLIFVLSSGVHVHLITQSMIASEEGPHLLCYMKMASTSSALSQPYLSERGWGGGLG